MKRAFAICLLLGVTYAAVHLKESSLSAAEEEEFIYLPLSLRSEPFLPSEEQVNEQTVVHMLNELRLSNGLSELRLAPELTASARGHSKDMAANHFTGHTGSNGSSPGQRIAEAGYVAWAWGEIIGWGFGGDPAAMVDWWMNSPVHRSLILSSTYTDFGAGYTRDSGSDWGHYWTVNFGARAAAKEISLDENWQLCSFSNSSAAGGSSLTVFSADPCP